MNLNFRDFRSQINIRETSFPWFSPTRPCGHGGRVGEEPGNADIRDPKIDFAILPETANGKRRFAVSGFTLAVCPYLGLKIRGW